VFARVVQKSAFCLETEGVRLAVSVRQSFQAANLWGFRIEPDIQERIFWNLCGKSGKQAGLEKPAGKLIACPPA
jgi:hypothetical protein